MNGHFVEGSVVSQQTVLQFLCHPLPVTTPSLPQCVVEERGGESRFAMNTHSQLQFHLAVPPDPHNLPTHFHMHPSPVVIERLPPTSLPTAERLALAVRLARRDLRRGNATPQHSAAVPGVGPEQRILPSHPQTTPPHQPLSYTVPLHQPPLLQTALPHQPLPQPALPHQPLHLALPHQPHPHVQERSGPSITTPVTEQPTDGQEQDQASREIAQLRKVLEHRVHLLNRTQGASEVGHRTGVKLSGGGGGRVWWEEAEGGEEREQRRRSEQAARNARLLYTLQQQVSSLQREMQHLPSSSTGSVRHTKKSQMVHKLAAVHRATVRTLHSYLPPLSPPIPPELSRLVQHLSLLRAQLKVGAEDADFQQTLKELEVGVPSLRTTTDRRSQELSSRVANIGGEQELQNPRRDALRAAGRENVAPGPRPRHKSTGGRRSRVKPKGVLLVRREAGRTSGRRPQLQPPRFSWHTHSTLLKRQPSSVRLHPHSLSPVPPHSTPTQDVKHERKSRRKGYTQWHSQVQTENEALTPVNTSECEREQSRVEEGRDGGEGRGQGWRGDRGEGRGQGWREDGGEGRGQGWRMDGGEGRGQGWREDRGEGRGQGWREDGGEGREQEWRMDRGEGRGQGWREDGGEGREQEWRMDRGEGRGQGWREDGRGQGWRGDGGEGGEQEWRMDGGEGREQELRQAGGKSGSWGKERRKGGQKWRREGQKGQKSIQEGEEEDEHWLADTGTYITAAASSPSVVPRVVESGVSVHVGKERGGKAAGEDEDTTKTITLREDTTHVGKSELEDSALLVNQLPNLSAMLTRVTELEAEEEQIRLRWSTITYSLHMDRPPPPEHPPSSSSTPPLSLPLPSSLLSSLHQYRDQYYHHLRSAGSGIQGVLHPWTLTGSIADELLDDLLLQVLTEVEQICDSCVDGLYTEEFVKP